MSSKITIIITEREIETNIKVSHTGGNKAEREEATRLTDIICREIERLGGIEKKEVQNAQ